MKVKYVSIIIMIALVNNNKALSQTFGCNNFGDKLVCIDTLLIKILQKKIEYEKFQYESNFTDANKALKEYKKLFRILKKNKKRSIECIKKVNTDKRFVQFIYFPDYQSVIPKCGHISYDSFKIIVLKNLIQRKKNDFTLECE